MQQIINILNSIIVGVCHVPAIPVFTVGIAKTVTSQPTDEQGQN
ncbi:MAG: hypothetical protein ACYTBJ_11450 [Planctomycetota bacterium]